MDHPDLGNVIIFNNLRSQVPEISNDVEALKAALEAVGFSVKSYDDCNVQVSLLQSINSTTAKYLYGLARHN